MVRDNKLEILVEEMIFKFFPEFNDKGKDPKLQQEFNFLKKNVIQDMQKLIEETPSFGFPKPENQKYLELLITTSINHRTLEKQINKVIDQYTKNLSPEERNEISLILKKEIEKMKLDLRLKRNTKDPKKIELSFMDNPIALQTMIGLLLKKLPVDKLKPEKLNPGTDPGQESIKKLIKECEKLILKMKQNGPSEKDIEKLEKLLLEIEKLKTKMMNKEDVDREVAILLNQITFGECKELCKLPLEQQTQIVTLGSRPPGGTWQLDASNDRPMPVGLVDVPKGTPIAQEAKNPHAHSPFKNLKETPTLKKEK